MAGGEAQLWEEGKEMRRPRAWMRVPLEAWLIKSSLGKAKPTACKIWRQLCQRVSLRYKVVFLKEKGVDFGGEVMEERREREMRYNSTSSLERKGSEE